MLSARGSLWYCKGFVLVRYTCDRNAECACGLESGPISCCIRDHRYFIQIKPLLGSRGGSLDGRCSKIVSCLRSVPGRCGKVFMEISGEHNVLWAGEEFGRLQILKQFEKCIIMAYQ